MLNYLTAEFNKLLRSKVFYMGIAGCVIIGFVTVALSKTFGYVDSRAGLVSACCEGFTNQFMSVIIVFAVTAVISERFSGTLRNAIALGYGKVTVYLSKALLGSLLMVLIVVTGMVTSILCGVVFYTGLFDVECFWKIMSRFMLTIPAYVGIYSVALMINYLSDNLVIFTLLYFILYFVLAELTAFMSKYSQMFDVLHSYYLHILIADIGSAETITTKLILKCDIWGNLCALISTTLGAAVTSRKEVR